MADMWTTRHALSKFPEGEELNPVANIILGRWGFKGLQVFKSGLAGALLISIGFIMNNDYLWYALVGTSFFPVLWNSIMIYRASRRNGRRK